MVEIGHDARVEDVPPLLRTHLLEFSGGPHLRCHERSLLFAVGAVGPTNATSDRRRGPRHSCAGLGYGPHTVATQSNPWHVKRHDVTLRGRDRDTQPSRPVTDHVHVHIRQAPQAPRTGAWNRVTTGAPRIRPSYDITRFAAPCPRLDLPDRTPRCEAPVQHYFGEVCSQNEGCRRFGSRFRQCRSNLINC